MYYQLEHIHRIIKDIKKAIHPKSFPITNYKIHYGQDACFTELELDDTAWEDYTTGNLWGGYDQHVCFRTTFTVPIDFESEHTLFCLHTGHKEGWDVTNPQFLIYVNGELIHGLDVNHRTTHLSDCIAAGQRYQITLLAYSGINPTPCTLHSELLSVDLKAKEFYYNISNLFDALCLLDTNSLTYVTLLSDLLEAVNLIDMRHIYSNQFYQTLDKANAQLCKKYYSAINTAAPVVSIIGHTHIDMAWLWTVDQTREKVVRSFSTVLELMKRYPEYKFMSSQPQLYSFLKEEAPDLYEQVKEKVKEGRWEVDGGMWVEADCNLPSGESLVRQLLFGIRFFEKEFDVRCQTLWLPDVFGYSAVLPQLLKQCGIKNFLTTKLDWNDRNKMPHDTFLWQGIDGSSVLTHLVTTTNACNYDDAVHTHPNTRCQTTYNGRLNANQVLGNWTRYQDKHLLDHTIQLFGFGDGGGGPTEEMLENAKRLKYGTFGVPRVCMNYQSEFFNTYHLNDSVQQNLSKWTGELYFEYHRGTYTSMAKNKRLNRQSEQLLLDLECFASLAHLLGEAYPQESINHHIKTLLLNQFHDIIPGTAIKKVYETTDKEYAQLITESTHSLMEILNTIAENIKLSNDSLIVFNSLSFDRTDLVEYPTNAFKEIPIAFSNEHGTLFDVQVTSDDTLIFNATDIPSKGYNTYTPVFSVSPQHFSQSSFIFQPYRLETPFYVIQFDKSYCMTSIYDKEAKRELIPEGKKANLLLLFEDRPHDFDNWNIDVTYTHKYYEVADVESVQVIENGPLRSCLNIIRRYGTSTINQRIYFYAHNRRIDFKTTCDWHEQNLLLKTAFEVDVFTSKATYDIQYGNVERTTHNNTSWDEAQFEVCGHKWADLSEADYGVSLLNDCKYGYSIKDGVMMLTLIKCGTYPNPDADQGLHEFTYSLYPHQHTWREAHTIKEAYKLNSPLYTLYKKDHKNNVLNVLPNHFSLADINCDNCMIEVIKKAEDSEDHILRIYECMQKRTNANITLSRPIQNVYECNLLEEKIKEIDIEEGVYAFSAQLNPYEIKTYLIRYQ